MRITSGKLFVYGTPLAVLVFLPLRRFAASAATLVSRLILPCPFNRITGLDCPGCGCTRSVLALLRGEVATSLRYNIIPVCVLLFLVLVYIEQAVREWGGDKNRRLFPRNRVVIVVIIVSFCIYSVLRNFVTQF